MADLSDSGSTSRARALESLESVASSLQDDRQARDIVQRAIRMLNTPPLATKVISADQISPLFFSVGSASSDGAAVLGRDGYLYLSEGSNNVLSRYARNQDSTDALAKTWLSLLDARKQRQKAQGRQFVQIIVPEKISSLPENFPQPLETPTGLLKALEAAGVNSSSEESYISVLQLFRSAGARAVPRLDSHQSTYGSYLVARAFARMEGSDALESIDFSSTEFRSGDLAMRFFGYPAYEEAECPNDGENRILAVAPKRVSTVEPPNGGHLGTQCIWQNPNAPIDKTVVVFGNSCFHRGGRSLLSWWFSRLYKNFHFVWSNEVDDDYASSVNADMVVGQSMERFLFARQPQR